jgi:hypothetical protein
MKTIYTKIRDEYYTSELTPDGQNLIENSIDVFVDKTLPEGINDDLFFDWLDSQDYFDKSFVNRIQNEVRELGYDMNLDNYYQVKCPYLPFIHYIHIPTGKFY